MVALEAVVTFEVAFVEAAPMVRVKVVAKTVHKNAAHKYTIAPPRIIAIVGAIHLAIRATVGREAHHYLGGVGVGLGSAAAECKQGSQG